MSARLKLTVSYAGFLMVAGVGLLAVVWVFLLRYVPEQALSIPADRLAEERTMPRPEVFFPGRSDLWEAFAPKAALMLLLLLVGGLVGGWVLAGRMLAPLKRITDATRRAQDGSLQHRIQLPGRRDEFRELADAFDSMLTQLEAHIQEQRRFAANASHELRTPLAITKTLLDVAREDSSQVNGELVEILSHVNNRAINLIEALLLLSRAEQRSFRREDVDLSLTAEEATETLQLFAERHGVSMESDGPVAQTIGSRALLLQMTINLVHNAIVHNLPEHGAVRISTSVGADDVSLHVENTGQILGPDTLATLTEPFQRGTERIRSDQTGVGLGLAIVKSIVAAHDGTLSLRPRPGGGLCVTVRIPSRAT